MMMLLQTILRHLFSMIKAGHYCIHIKTEHTCMTWVPVCFDDRHIKCSLCLKRTKYGGCIVHQNNDKENGIAANDARLCNMALVTLQRCNKAWSTFRKTDDVSRPIGHSSSSVVSSFCICVSSSSSSVPVTSSSPLSSSDRYVSSSDSASRSLSAALRTELCSSSESAIA